MAMDKRFNKLQSWLFFELLLTVAGFGLWIYHLRLTWDIVDWHIKDTIYLSVIIALIARIFFLGSAWLSLSGDHTLGNEDEPEVLDDSTPIDPHSEG
jgi:hypothetical protein